MIKFEVGKVVYTCGIANLLENEKIERQEILGCLYRHATGDWGNLCEEDKQANEDALKHGDRILSSYEIGKDKTKIWIITEWDRSYTTILLPEEY